MSFTPPELTCSLYSLGLYLQCPNTNCINLPFYVGFPLLLQCTQHSHPDSIIYADVQAVRSKQDDMPVVIGDVEETKYATVNFTPAVKLQTLEDDSD